MNLHRTYFALPKDLLASVDAVRSCARAQKVRLYLVGGMVRDMVMGRPNFDLDICVEGSAIAVAEAAAAKLGVTCKTHVAFGTATIFSSPYPVDVAMCREEIYEKPGALPTVTLSTLDKDLKRRDFTVNALAMSLNDDDFGTVIDPYDGLRDIRQKFIRVLHKQSFVDDPTRLFRGVRFKERFGFSYEHRTNRLIKEAVLQGCFRTISPQRVRKELTLIAEEEHVAASLRSLYRLTGFSFLPGVACREKPDVVFLSRVFDFAREAEKRHPASEALSSGWLLFAFLYRYASAQEKEHMAVECGFTRQERKMFVGISLADIAKLDRVADAAAFDKYLEGVTREGIIFVGASLRNARMREHILSHFFK